MVMFMSPERKEEENISNRWDHYRTVGKIKIKVTQNPLKSGLPQ